MHTVLDALDRHKERLLAIVDSEDTTPDDKYEALMRLASLTEILSREARNTQIDTLPTKASRWDDCFPSTLRSPTREAEEEPASGHDGA